MYVNVKKIDLQDRHYAIIVFAVNYFNIKKKPKPNNNNNNNNNYYNLRYRARHRHMSRPIILSHFLNYLKKQG